MALVGDDDAMPGSRATSAPEPWRERVAAMLSVRLVTLARAGAGWAAGDLGAPSFADRASTVPSDAALVLFAGGLRDAGRTSRSIEDAVASSFAAARARAPRARVVVIGRAAPAPDAAARALASALRAGAASRDAAFDDPVSQRWLPGGGAGLAGSAADQDAIARRAVSIIQATG